ncbi:MAG: hypothetical protein A4E57_00005 [Syntrophorhabdaceae bacterium PtaU1.Bin034]|nr:MAG: hypothetical protein A4E57_00005 [Syntrophorhabdaceae bacterium PtaU1.Bin034]
MKGEEKRKKLLTIESAAESYSQNIRTLRTSCLLGKVKGVKIGRKWFVTPEEMERLAREGYLNPRDPY